MTTRVILLAAMTVTAVLLSGCSGPVDDDSSPGTSVRVPSGAGEETEATPDPDSDGFPTCDEVKAALGDEVAELVEIADSENGVSVGYDGPSLGCAWYTDETASASTDLAAYGFISLGVSRDPTYTEQSMESLGWIVDDARVAGIGAWALKPGGEYNPADQLDATGVQVVKDGVIVVLTASGVALQDVPELAPLTNEWALGSGVAVLELMEQQ